MGGMDAYTSAVTDAVAKINVVGYAIVAVALYVIVCVGLQNIARRRRICGNWLAWVPVANLWVLGSISDQYQYLVKGRICARRWILPILAVLALIVYLAGAYCLYLSAEMGYVDSLVPTLPMLLLFVCVVFLLAALVALVLYLYICAYNLFCSCEPENGKLFLVLSILCPAGMAFIVFAIRKRDGGMPPRKQPAEEMPMERLAELTREISEITEEGEAENEQEEPVADA